MFLGFHLDYQTNDYIRAVVAPFGRLLHWYESPNKSRVLIQCLVIAPERVPRSIVLSQGTILGVVVNLGQPLCTFLMATSHMLFPHDENPVPADGNPHPIHGVPVLNPNVAQHCHHDLAGAAQGIHIDAGLNDQDMQNAQDDIVVPHENDAEDCQC